MELLSRFFAPPGQSYYLFGPRGTGKTAWTQMYYENAARIDLLQPDVLRRYQGNPERIRDFVHAQPDGQTILVDESTCSIRAFSKASGRPVPLTGPRKGRDRRWKD